MAAGAGLTATAILLSFYFGVLTQVSGWSFTVQQFGAYWPFLVALAIGFGIQVSLFSYLRRAVHAEGSAKVMVTTGTTSGAAMVSCCTHYLVNLLPVLGATGLVSFVGQSGRVVISLGRFRLLSVEHRPENKPSPLSGCARVPR